MAFYQIEWKRSAQKELRKLPATTIRKILDAVEHLAEQPFPPGVKKLVGTEQTYRVRVGDYRIVYDVLSSMLVIEIIRVGHRKDVYNG